LAIAPQTACGYVQRWMPWHAHAAAIAGGDDGAIDEAVRDRGALQAERDHRREARDRAWAGLAQGGDLAAWTMDDALALSELARRLDADRGFERAPAAGRATLADLPRADWWYLFTPPAAWSRGPLAIDRERRPGAYAALMEAMEHVVAVKPGAPALGPDAYL